MQDDIAKIAAGLSEAQRSVLGSSFHDARRHGPYHVYIQRPNSLQSCLAMARRGLIAKNEYADEGYEFFERGKITGYMVLTPLGLAVRAHLMEER